MEKMTLDQAMAKGRCDKCRRRVKGDQYANGIFRAGILVGFLCGKCQSPADVAEATINEATLDYTTVKLDAFGRATIQAKG